MLLLTVDNSFDGMILKKEEKILSRKRKDEAGIGICSMQQICENIMGPVGLKQQKTSLKQVL